MAASNLLDIVGNTPLVRLSRLDTGPCALFAKLETQDPGGSIKDRIATSMIDAAERQACCAPAERLSKRPLATPGSHSPWWGRSRAIEPCSWCRTR
jgi:cystathionine beta-synthase